MANKAAAIILDELKIELQAARKKGFALWEEKLKLWIKPKPRFLPQFLWKKIVNIVVTQSVDFGKGMFNHQG